MQKRCLEYAYYMLTFTATDKYLHIVFNDIVTGLYFLFLEKRSFNS